ncbi:hypothetical protein BCR34DRAFT_608017 [Clohesyomyces aquaticus]|uniref:GEgh 16 protein n=1 Tax=Clohesyomyces aquaticus TaxID=1231657 RepID=A0A1Y1YAY7_9PLEO|nr:hypothetical protein BCR34DRAFT_608017 [Clohesyomyces aquaticus]
MLYTSSLLAFIALAPSVRSHGVILKAVGVSGPEGQGFLVDQNLARNCTTISPCQQDATIIRDSEITQNIVNSCGRTEIAGNIDVGEQTELELAAKRVTQVTKGSTIAVTIHQVNADGAGPYECDLDQSSNAAVNFVKLQVANNVPGANGLSQAKEQDFTINVKMPADFNCFGASTGDICTVRCRNNAVAGPFGGCFAVQQTDGTGRTNTSAAAVDTAQTLSGVLAQVEQNKKDLPAAIAANQAAGASGVDEGLLAISALVSSAPVASATAVAGNGKGNGKGNRNGNNGGKGNGNTGNAAGNTGNAASNAGNANGNAKGNGNGNGNANGKGNANANNARARMARGLGKFLA